jgi:predicted RNase H-like nuclease (RuvC/YqgF family)
MNADFSNTYQEVLFDNLMVIIKQNFMFQTQLKLAENVGNKNAELQAQIQKIIEENISLSEKAKEADSYKSRVETNVSAHEEKNRIQIALNAEMRKTATLQKELDDLKEELNILKSYVKNLEEIAPATKLKKINSSVKTESTSETAKTAIEPTTNASLPIKANDGSSF